MSCAVKYGWLNDAAEIQWQHSQLGGHACESHTLMVVSFDAEYRSPSPPHRTQLTARLWLDMLQGSQGKGRSDSKPMRISDVAMEGSSCAALQDTLATEMHRSPPRSAFHKNERRPSTKLQAIPEEALQRGRIPHAQRPVLRPADKAATGQPQMRRFPRHRRHPFCMPLWRGHGKQVWNQDQTMSGVQAAMDPPPPRPKKEKESCRFLSSAAGPPKVSDICSSPVLQVCSSSCLATCLADALERCRVCLPDEHLPVHAAADQPLCIWRPCQAQHPVFVPLQHTTQGIDQGASRGFEHDTDRAAGNRRTHAAGEYTRTLGQAAAKRRALLHALTAHSIP